eukprot:TRINITY_DN2493_c0_g1_i2.p1 TRINITY_DN2493_c0_g1~~TRINITY_DN2493_c0_g1_i2.p1  ORF type:complete len:220 (+),score=39.09 TRINITY_DN2493_c0_g1_i2:164-823(+)
MIGLVPIGSLLGGLVSTMIVLLLKWMLVGRMKVGDRKIWGASFMMWEFVSHLISSADANFMIAFRGSIVFVWWLRLLGCDIGKDCYISMRSPQEPDLLHVGAGSVLDDCDIVAHHFDGHAFRLEHVRIGTNCNIGFKSSLLPRSIISNGVTMMPLTVVLVGETLPAMTCWRGSCAELVKKSIVHRTARLATSESVQDIQLYVREESVMYDGRVSINRSR